MHVTWVTPQLPRSQEVTIPSSQNFAPLSFLVRILHTDLTTPALLVAHHGQRIVPIPYARDRRQCVSPPKGCRHSSRKSPRRRNIRRHRQHPNGPEYKSASLSLRTFPLLTSTCRLRGIQIYRKRPILLRPHHTRRPYRCLPRLEAETPRSARGTCPGCQ